MLLERSHMYGSHVKNIHISAQFTSFNSCYPLYFHLFHKHYNTSAKSNKYLQSLAIKILIACHTIFDTYKCICQCFVLVNFIDFLKVTIFGLI
jgi:hypothetical protein